MTWTKLGLTVTGILSVWYSAQYHPSEQSPGSLFPKKMSVIVFILSLQKSGSLKTSINKWLHDASPRFLNPTDDCINVGVLPSLPIGLFFLPFDNSTTHLWGRKRCNHLQSDDVTSLLTCTLALEGKRHMYIFMSAPHCFWWMWLCVRLLRCHQQASSTK